MTEHLVMIGFDVEAPTREMAARHLVERLVARRVIDRDPAPAQVTSWWTLEARDKHIDRNDLDALDVVTWTRAPAGGWTIPDAVEAGAEAAAALARAADTFDWAHFTCTEFDTLHALLRAHNHHEAAHIALMSHVGGDKPSDGHYRYQAHMA